MLTQLDNERLTAVGPGTLMGNLLREYFIPALKSDELPVPDCDPVRVMLLGEKLIAFRDTAGRVGLLSEGCPHRGASLFYGRNEEQGLRCAYHGWHFNVRGECIGMPLEPEDGGQLLRRIRTRAYPCVERGGIVWTYMGPRETPPPLPEIEMNMEPRRGRLDVMQVDCNWLQNLEGDIDIDHIPVLHGSNVEYFKAIGRGDRGAGGKKGVEHRPHAMVRMPMQVADSTVGCTFACHITAAARDRFGARALPELWAVGQFMLPFYAMLPYGSLGAHWIVARVPMDDHHTMSFGMYSPDAAVPSEEMMFGLEPTRQPNSPDWFGRFRLTRNPENDFGLDRSIGKSGRGPFAVGAGFSGQAIQDSSIACSMGPIADRTREHLSAGDLALVQMRKRLLSSAIALSELGTAPPGVDFPSGYRMKQGILRARSGRTWEEELTIAEASAI